MTINDNVYSERASTTNKDLKMANYKQVRLSGELLDYFLVKAKAEDRRFGQQVEHELRLVMKAETENKGS